MPAVISVMTNALIITLGPGARGRIFFFLFLLPMVKIVTAVTVSFPRYTHHLTITVIATTIPATPS